MEPKNWPSVASILVLALIFLVTLHFNATPGSINDAFIGKLKGVIPGMVRGGGVASEEKQKISLAISPNLSSCHRSLKYDGPPVYCCPPPKDDPIIDFEFPGDSLPFRIRRPAYKVNDPEYIAKYYKAIAIMKSLPYDDPRSFDRQAQVHCIYCTNAIDQDHNNVPLNVHFSWLFFPFHRMFVYFHERILASLIGDDTFALPFWAWDIPEGMMIPGFYLNGSLYDMNRDTSHFPPHIVDLNFNPNNPESTLGPADQQKANLGVMYNQLVSAAKKIELFMGCRIKAGEDGYCFGRGTMEVAPHDTAHGWTGSNVRLKREDMGSFYSAAWDPLFFAHHTNIDRLWDVWREIHKIEFTDNDFLDTSFLFYNEKKQLVRIKIRDVLDASKFRYGYEEVEIPWLNARPKPSVPPKAAREMLKMRMTDQNILQMPGNHHFLSSDFSPEGKDLNNTVTVRLSRPRTSRSKKEKEEEEEVLVVYGIEVQKDEYIKFDVFVNVVDETIVSPEFREFAGTFVHIPMGVKLERNEGGKRKENLKLGISELLEDLEAEADENIWVTLIPRTQNCIHTRVDGVRIEYMV